MSGKKALGVLFLVIVVFYVTYSFTFYARTGRYPWESQGGGYTSSSPSYRPSYTYVPSYTYTPPPQPDFSNIGTLNGTVTALGGDLINEVLWSRMVEFNASDPRVNGYVKWLLGILGAGSLPFNYTDVIINRRYTHGYRDNTTNTTYYVFDAPYRYTPLPSDPVVVRTGVIRLPFGGGLIVSGLLTREGAYVVIHGTILNATEYREGVLRLLSFDTATRYYNPFIQPSYNNETAWRDQNARWELDSIASHIYFELGSLTGYNDTGISNDVQGVLDKFRYVGWAYWRIWMGGGGYINTYNVSVPIMGVVVLLEMPVVLDDLELLYKRSIADDFYTSYYYAVANEGLFWDVVGHPAVSLGVRLVYWNYDDIVSLYRNVVLGLTLSVVTADTTYVDDVYTLTPLMFRLTGGGICGAHTWSTAMFAEAIGGYVGIVYMDSGDKDSRGQPIYHAISVLILGDGEGTIDVNGDGVTDSVVIVDTAYYPESVINKSIRDWVNIGDRFDFGYPFMIPVNVAQPVYTSTEPKYWTLPYLSRGPVYHYGERYGFDESMYIHTFDVPAIVDYYAGVYDAVLKLPEWLKAPWLNYTMSLSNLTGVFRLADDYVDRFGILREVYEYVEMSVRNLGRSNVLPPLPLSFNVLPDVTILDYSGTPSVKVPLPSCGVVSAYAYFYSVGFVLHGIGELVLPPCQYTILFSS